MKRQSGFTLIELIIVIVILGILAVTAAPQFFNFGSDARESTVRGLEGSIKTASDLVHARAQINTQQDTNSDGDVTDFVEIRDGETALVDGLYAEASVGGIGAALSLGTGDWTSMAGQESDGAIAWHPASITKGGDWTDVTDVTDEEAPVKGCYAYYVYDGTGVPTIGSVTNDC